MSSNGLIVRRTERFEISLPTKVRVGLQHVDQVQFAKGVVGEGRWMTVELVDFAEGGIGFVSESFFARGLSLDILVPGFGANAGQTVLQCEIQVKRVQMTDRRPSYLIGCAFVNLSDEQQASVHKFLDRLGGQADASVDADGSIGGHGDA